MKACLQIVLSAAADDEDQVVGVVAEGLKRCHDLRRGLGQLFFWVCVLVCVTTVSIHTGPADATRGHRHSNVYTDICTCLGQGVVRDKRAVVVEDEQPPAAPLIKCLIIFCFLVVGRVCGE